MSNCYCLKQELEDKIKMLTVRGAANAAYKFADPVRNLLKKDETETNINSLDLLKQYWNGEDISLEALQAGATYTAAHAGAYTAAHGAAYAAVSTAVLSGDADAYTAALNAASFARLASPSITLESQVAIVTQLLLQIDLINIDEEIVYH